MQAHVRDPAARRASKETIRRKVVLAGNPNVGKSVIFNALTGENVDVSNYPGTTIDISYGRLGPSDLIDTPGVYGISSFNDEERAARAIILKADLIVNIASALSLDRDLFLTLQLIDMGKPMLLVLNQWDEAEHRGLKIDTHLLATLLGVHVIITVAVRGQGIPELKGGLHLGAPGNVNLEIGQLLAPLLNSGVPQEHAVLILEGDESSTTEYGITPCTWRAEIYRARRQLVNELVAQTVTYGGKTTDLSIRLGRLLLHPVYGFFIALSVCYLIFYQLLGVLVAGNLVDFTEKKAMRVYYEPLVRRLAATVFPCTVTIGDHTFTFPSGTATARQKERQFQTALDHTPPDKVQYNFWPNPGIATLIGNCLVGEYGILTLTVTYLLGLLMPLVLGFYFGLSLLEDSGYLPRLAVLVDRLMSKLGLNGRAIIPLILGLGCVTMATITTRLLSSKREKIIASALLGIAIPCSAQLGVVSGVLAKAGGLFAWTVYLTVIGSVLAITGVLLNMILPGKSGALLIDLPPMRVPRVDNVIKKTWRKSWNFLQDASVPFFLAALVVTLAQASGLLNLFIHVLQPITVSWLNLPPDPRVATTFILGIVRRDFAAFGLTDVALTSVQAVVAMIVVTLFVPCIATVGVMMKERGPKIALSIWFGSWLCAFVIGGVLAQILPSLFHLVGAS